MKKIILALVLFLSLSSLTFSAEQANSVWVNNIAVNGVYIGDYNVSGGRAYIGGSDGYLYSFPANTVWGKLMYSTALAAKSMGKRVDVLRGPTSEEFTPTAFPIFRVRVVD